MKITGANCRRGAGGHANGAIDRSGNLHVVDFEICAVQKNSGSQGRVLGAHYPESSQPAATGVPRRESDPGIHNSIGVDANYGGPRFPADQADLIPQLDGTKIFARRNFDRVAGLRGAEDSGDGMRIRPGGYDPPLGREEEIRSSDAPVKTAQRAAPIRTPANSQPALLGALLRGSMRARVIA